MLVDATVIDGVDAGGGTVLDNQDTGPLEPESIYLGVLMGMTGEPAPKELQMKFWKVQPSVRLNGVSPPPVMFINASPSAPAVDFGYWTKGDTVDTYTPVLTNFAYGSASPGAGTDFAAPPYSPTVTQPKLGVQPTGDVTPNRSANRVLLAQFSAVVLLGDWTATNPADPSRLVAIGNWGANVGAATWNLSIP
jgi:hypothetical protein